MADMNEMMRRLLYYPDRLPRDLPPPAWAGRCEEVRLECEDGLNIHGLWWPEPAGAPVILFFHGNAQEAYSWSPVHSELEPLGCRLLLIDYHGYGKSDGEPGEEALYMDGRASVAWLAGRGVDDGDIIVFGESLGGAVACEISRERRFRALILESTFTSLASVASRLFPMVPGGLELSEAYTSIDKIGRAACPVLVIHGDRDELIPPREGLRLFEAAPSPKELFVVNGAGHNDVSYVAGDDYARRIGDFLGL